MREKPGPTGNTDPNTKMVDAENDSQDRKVEVDVKENMDSNQHNGELVPAENEERDVC